MVLHTCWKDTLTSVMLFSGVSREISHGSKYTLPYFGSALWLVYVLKQTFEREDFVSSKKNVWLGGNIHYKGR